MIVGWLDDSVRKLTIFYRLHFHAGLEHVQCTTLRGRPVFHQAAFSNRAFWLVTLEVVVGQVAIVQWGGKVFRTEPLAFEEMAGHHWGDIERAGHRRDRARHRTLRAKKRA